MISGGSFDHMVEFHEEAGTWWAECADFPGFSAAADTYHELYLLVADSMEELSGPSVRWYSHIGGSSKGGDVSG